MYLILMMYEHAFFLEGEPEGKELESIEEEKLLEIHRAFQQKLKERDAEREKNITKKIQEYEQKILLYK